MEGGGIDPEARLSDRLVELDLTIKPAGWTTFIGFLILGGWLEDCSRSRFLGLELEPELRLFV